MSFELWETGAGNIVGDYPTKVAALAVVRSCVVSYGRDYVDSWALVYEDKDENVHPIAAGEELARLAEKAVSA